MPPPPPPPPAADSCSLDNFVDFFNFWHFWRNCWIWPIDKIIWLDFGWYSSWPWPWIFKVNMDFAIYLSQKCPIATKLKINISIDLKASNVTIGFDLGHDLDLENSRSNMEFAISLPKMVRLPRNEKQTYRLNSRPQIVKCDHHIWPWPWLFKVKYGLCYISTKTGLIATKRKANISNELQASIATNGFDLGHDLDIWFSSSNVILTIWWPRSGIRIYQMMTGVTSDVGVLWTHAHLVPITKIRLCHMSYLYNEIYTWKDSLYIETEPCISAVKIFSRKGHH